MQKDIDGKRRAWHGPARTTMNKPQLIERRGILCLPNAAALIRHTKHGDCDTLNWPDSTTEHIRAALYDARETGDIGNVPAVTLPDGTTLEIDA